MKHMIILWILFIIEPPCQSNEKEKEDEGADKDYHRNDEQVNLCLECKGNLKHLKKKYLRISSQATICHLKKFLALKVFNDISKYGDVSLTVLNFDSVGDHYSCQFYSLCIGSYDLFLIHVFFCSLQEQKVKLQVSFVCLFSLRR